ncbi:MAG: hypothetical protein HC850_04035 [Rhodomicrobium sp.]|nr:hypothetical protein [Rhodomicrobium sp.]
MAAVLLCCEGGGGLGHIIRLRRIAAELSRRGAVCHAALIKPDKGRGFAESFSSILQAPGERWGSGYPPKLQLSPDPRDACNTTFQLWELGFWRRETVAANVLAWQRIFAEIKPDAVVADLAPFALLAAAGRIPTFCVGNGFFVPATVGGYFSPDGKPASPQDCAAQDEFFEIARAALKDIGLEPPSNIALALCSDAPCPAALPALDPRYAIRAEALAPPELEEQPGEFPAPQGDRVLVYLGQDVAAHRVLLDGVAASGLPAILYVSPNAAAGLPAMRNLVVRTQPFTLREIAGLGGLVVHHGGIGITHASALAGVPQWIGYRGYERWRNAQAAFKQGAAVAGSLESLRAEHVASSILRLATSSDHKRAARDWAAASHKWIGGRRGQDVIADRIMHALGRR